MGFTFVALEFQCTGIRGRAERARGCVYVELLILSDTVE